MHDNTFVYIRFARLHHQRVGRCENVGRHSMVMMIRVRTDLARVMKTSNTSLHRERQISRSVTHVFIGPFLAGMGRT